MSFPNSLKISKLIVIILVVVFTVTLFAVEDIQKLGPKAKRDLRSANMYLSQKIYDKAKPLYESVLEENPIHLEALEKLTGIYYQVENDYVKANNYYSKLISIIDSLYAEYEELKKTDEDEAEVFYKKNIEDYDLEKKRETFVKLKGNCWRYIYQNALDNYKQKDFDTAIAKYKKLYAETPDSANVITMIANSFIQKEVTDSALVWLKKAASINTEDDALASQIASIYFNKQNFEEAANWYEKATDIDPEDPNHQYNLAICYTNAGMEEEAFEAYMKVVEMLPDDIDAILMANNLAIRLNKTEKSVELLKKAIELEPDNIDFLSMLSYQLYQKEDYEGVLDYAKRWFDADNNAKEAVQLLYQSARKTNNPELTKKYEEIYRTFE